MLAPAAGKMLDDRERQEGCLATCCLHLLNRTERRICINNKIQCESFTLKKSSHHQIPNKRPYFKILTTQPRPKVNGTHEGKILSCDDSFFVVSGEGKPCAGDEGIVLNRCPALLDHYCDLRRQKLA